MGKIKLTRKKYTIKKSKNKRRCTKCGRFL